MVDHPFLSYCWNKPFNVIHALTSGMSGFILAILTGLISDEVDNLQLQIITSTSCTIFGFFLGGYFTEKKGPRWTLLFSDVVFFIGTILIVSNLNVFNILGKGCVGIGTGLTFMTSALYVVESSPENLRGGLVVLSELGNSLGPPFLYFLRLILRQELVGVVVATLPIIQFLILLIFIKENAVWLLYQNKEDEALRDLERKFVTVQEAHKQLQTLKTLVLKLKLRSRYSVWKKIKMAFSSTIFRRAVLRGLVPVIVSQMVFPQYILYIKNLALEDAKFSKSVEVGISVCASVIGFTWESMFIEGVGRKRILLLSLWTMSTDLALMSSLVYVFPETPSRNMMATVLIDIYLLMYGPGFGVIPLLVNTEDFQFKFRPIGSAVAGAADKFIHGVILLFMLPRAKAASQVKVLSIVCMLSILGIITISFLLPEDKKPKEKKRALGLRIRMGKRIKVQSHLYKALQHDVQPHQHIE